LRNVLWELWLGALGDWAGEFAIRATDEVYSVALSAGLSGNHLRGITMAIPCPGFWQSLTLCGTGEVASFNRILTTAP